ncbi:MAG: hypothetical protein AAF903_11805 [Pseudomonadota bacterium]
MKTTLRPLAVCLFAGIALPAYAADMLVDPPMMPPPVAEPAKSDYGSGYVEGAIDIHSGRDGKKDEDRWSLRGTHSVNFAKDLNVQVDVAYRKIDGCCADDSTFSGTFHLFKRDPKRFAIGAWGHMAQNEDAIGKTNDLLAGGLEAAAFMGEISILGHIGIGVNETDTTEQDVTIGGLEGRYYATDNIRFDAKLNMDHTQLSKLAEHTSTHFALQANWRMDQAPVSLFAGYRYEREFLDIEGANLDPSEADVLYVGARFHWGSDTLKQEERHGPLWQTNGAVGD